MIVSFLDFFAFSGGFSGTKNNAPSIQSDTGKMRCSLDFLPYLSYVNINNKQVIIEKIVCFKINLLCYFEKKMLLQSTKRYVIIFILKR